MVVKRGVETKPLKVLVISDVHLKPYMFDRAEKILKSGQASYAVCLGDYVDEWDCENSLDMYKETFDRMFKLKSDFPSTVFLIGNHDYSYIYPELGCSGHSERSAPIVSNELGHLKHLTGDFKVIVKLGKVLFSHAGLTKSFIDEHYATVREHFRNPKQKFGFHLSGKFIDYVINDINIIANSPHSHGDLWADNSVLWARPQHTGEAMYDKPGYVQVVGHTPMKTVEQQGNVISTDVFSLYNYYPYLPYGEEKFIIVNCADGTWEYANE